MAEEFSIKQDDTLPKIAATLYRDASKSTVVDLSTAIGVNFHMMARAELDEATPTLKVEAAATILAPSADGKVEYAWADGSDTDTDGVFLGEFEVEWSATSRTTYPNNGYIVITITKDLDSTGE